MSDMLKDIQKTENEILRELDRICKKHNIEYFLGQGTLLGAAKYKGFIPWDDDMDVLMRYDELDRLIKIFPDETRKDYLITNYTIERHYPLAWTKIRDKNTLSRPVRYKAIPINWGICIDLFPVYPVSDSGFLRGIELSAYKAANKLIMAELTKYEDKRGSLDRMLEKTPIGFRHFCMDLITGILKKHGGDSEYVLIPCKGVKLVKRNIIFGEKKLLEFEGEKYPVPADHHTYLTINYGDYTQPPPPDDKRDHAARMGEIEWRTKKEG